MTESALPLPTDLAGMESNPKLISVVIPTYNRRSFIAAAVESVLQQDWPSFEVIVVDDGSTDDSIAILEAIADTRLRVIKQANQGRSHARNVALNEARGDYIAFLDSDDLFLPGKLSRQVAWLEANPDFGMVYTASDCIDAEGNRLGHTYQADVSGDIYAEVAFFQPVTITLPTVMLRRQVLATVGMFDERMQRFEDTDLWRRISKRYRIGALPEVTCLVRTHTDNALVGQDPARIVAAIEYYLAKIEREDGDVPRLVRAAGARRLCEYYAAAMLSVPAFAPFGEALRQRAASLFRPKVSIIIPVYNGADFLAEAISSALAQTYQPLEVIVVNDGSTDDGASARVARGFGGRIHYVEKPNGGVATALNRGIEEMTGDFFSWLSHDDLYVPTKVAVGVGALWRCPNPCRCVPYSDYAVFTGNSKKTTPVLLPQVQPADFRYFITTQNVLHGCTLLVPKAAFDEHGGFNPALRTTQDYDLWFRMAASVNFVHVSQVLVKARSHAGQGSLAMSDLMLTECNTLLAGFVDELTAAEVTRAGAMSLAVGYFKLASNLTGRGFHDAGAHAKAIGRACLVDREMTGADWTALLEEVVVVKGELEAICAERDHWQALAARHQQALAAIYHSRSWRLTAPLRSGIEYLRAKRGPRQIAHFARIVGSRVKAMIGR
jgi:glycosyltransferase involved in cell wall biosynthesis